MDAPAPTVDILDVPGPDVAILKNLLINVRNTGSVKDPARSTKRKFSPSRDAEVLGGLCEKSASANEFAQHELPTNKRDAAALPASLDFTPLPGPKAWAESIRVRRHMTSMPVPETRRGSGGAES